MGFETQEQAERWAENIEMQADAAKENKLLKPTDKERIAILHAALTGVARAGPISRRCIA